jgi:hypothetical protein
MSVASSGWWHTGQPTQRAARSLPAKLPDKFEEGGIMEFLPLRVLPQQVWLLDRSRKR